MAAGTFRYTMNYGWDGPFKIPLCSKADFSFFSMIDCVWCSNEKFTVNPLLWL